MHRTMMISGALLLALTGCTPHSAPQAAPTSSPSSLPMSPQVSPPTGSLCDRLQQDLRGSWMSTEGELGFSVPLADTCSLVNAAQPNDQVRVMVSPIAVTDREFTSYRKADGDYLREVGYVTRTVDAGVGAGSWAVNPAAAAPWLVFRSGGRVIRLRMVNDGSGELAELRSLAQAVLAIPGGPPSAPAKVTRPECTRGAIAAERLLGEKAILERDSVIDGHLSCQWGSTMRSVVVRAGASGSSSALDFVDMKDAASSGLAHSVQVGAEGWQQTDGQLTFRTVKGTYVEVWMSPLGESYSGSILALARAIAPAYG
jgi:hypothetical protein